MYNIIIEKGESSAEVTANTSAEASYKIAKYLLRYADGIEMECNNRGFVINRGYSEYMIEKLKTTRLAILKKQFDNNHEEASRELEREMECPYSSISDKIGIYREGKSLAYFRNSSSLLRWLFRESDISNVETIKDDLLDPYLTSPVFSKVGRAGQRRESVDFSGLDF